jgi:hypothetical protein
MFVRRRAAAAVLAAALAAVAAGTAIGSGIGDDGHGSGSADGDPSTAPTAVSSTRSDPTGQHGSELAPSAPPTPTRSAVPRQRGGVAVMPDNAPGSGLPGLDPPSIPLPSAKELPAASVFARGRLVEGYPQRLLPLGPRTDVLSSSISPSDDRAQIALVARTAGSTDALLRFYRVRLGRAGFVEEPVTAVAGATAVSFTRDGSSVVVTVDNSRARSYSLVANLIIGQA